MVHFRVRDIKEKLNEFNRNVADDKKLDFYHFINRSYLNPRESVRHNVIVGNNIRIVTFDVTSYYYWELEVSGEMILRATLDECFEKIKSINKLKRKQKK